MGSRTEPLRFAILGTGFWARYQLAAWQELPGARCVALYNRTRAKAEALADEFGIPAVYDDPETLLSQERLDFVDVITDVDSHPAMVDLAARHRVPVICQKPMAPTVAAAEQMVSICRNGGVPFFVHENWRWQAPIRALKADLATCSIGHPFRARLQFSNSFPVFDNQPFLKQVEQFILADMGSHILDVARFLFGEATSLYCQTARIHQDICGEDVATVMMRMGEDTTVTCELSYASRLESERFPEVFILVEGERGSVELARDHTVRLTTAEGTWSRRVQPVHYAWANPAYDLVQSAVVPCNANILAALRGEGQAETSGEDNLRTVRLVHAAYASAHTGQVVAP
ncbi:MAG: Gfo/Idh/MocA family protein [Anaerolineae bacterium]